MTAHQSKPKVLVIGPLGAVGGMATSMRLQLSSSLGEQYELIPLDSSKRTPEKRSAVQGVIAQLGLARDLLLMLMRHRPALVHIHTCSGLTFYRSILDLWLSKLFRAQVLLHIRGGRFHEFLSQLSGITHWLVRRTLLRADGVIVLGAVWAERLYHFDPRIRLTVIHNGVVSIENEPRQTNDEIVRIVFVGTLKQTKGIDDLIQAVAELPERMRAGLEVRLIGPDPDRRAADVAGRITRLRLQQTIVMTGALSPEQVREELRRASIFVLPSYAEGLPNALLEAMACGLPCVTSSVGAVSELITNGSQGILIRPGDTKALTDALRRLIEQPVLRRRLGQSAQLRASRDFSQDKVSLSLAALYRRMLTPAGAPG